MQFKRGQIVYARVEEHIRPHDYILSYQGQLIRVENKTGQSWSKGEQVPLQVRGVNPLSFQIYKRLPTKFSLQV